MPHTSVGVAVVIVVLTVAAPMVWGSTLYALWSHKGYICTTCALNLLNEIKCDSAIVYICTCVCVRKQMNAHAVVLECTMYICVYVSV